MRSLIRPPAKGKLRLFRPRPPLGGSGIRYADGRVGNHQAAGTVRQRVKRGPRPAGVPSRSRIPTAHAWSYGVGRQARARDLAPAAAVLFPCVDGLPTSREGVWQGVWGGMAPWVGWARVACAGECAASINCMLCVRVCVCLSTLSPVIPAPSPGNAPQ